MRALIICMIFSGGCLSDIVPTHQPNQVPRQIHAARVPIGIFDTLNEPTAAHMELCENDGTHPNFPDDADIVTKSFCQDLKGLPVPAPTGIKELQTLLGLDFKDPNGENGAGGNPAFTLGGASSSLVARFISAINPRAFVFTPLLPDGTLPPGFAILTFTRGENFAEIAVHDPTLDEINFYLFRLTRDCGEDCSPAELLSPAVESGWKRVDIYESDTALANTVADCQQCHQPIHDDKPLLRMPEIGSPYTHFFSQKTEGGQALLDDFHAAHGNDEDWGPIPATMIDKSDPQKLRELVMAAGSAEQPNPLDVEAMEREVKASSTKQPWVNDPPGESPTWRAAYDQAAAGRFIAVPYHDVKVSDAKKLSAMTAAYRDFLSGARGDLPDIRDLYLDRGLRDMGFAPRLGQSGRELMVNVCQQCHNSRLDQELSRAKFNIEQLDAMTREEKDKAINRMLKPVESREHMPPVMFRTLADNERNAIIDELRK